MPISNGVLVFPSDSPLNCNYYRIPSLLTLKSGRVVAAADARFGGTHDAKSHIAIAVNHSDDGGKTWSAPRFAMHLRDYADQKTLWPTAPGVRDLQIQGSACFIDPVMVEDRQRGRLFLMADMMPAGVGSPNSQIGSGFVWHDGQPCLKLRKKGDAAYSYSLRQGVIYDDRRNAPTEYTVDQNLKVSFRGMPLTLWQYRVDIRGDVLEETQTDVAVPMHLFYRDSLFQAFPTNYLAMVYSDDGGETWSSPRLLSYLKPEDEKLLVTGPGVGIQIVRGHWAGRLVVPVYSVTKTNFGVLYSDDGGNSWHYAPTDPPGKDTSGEPQIFELPDGSLRAYLRTDRSQVVHRTSVDGGLHWSAPQTDLALTATQYGTQLSVLSTEIEGKPKVFLSAPASTTGRNTGVIHRGAIIDTGKTGESRYRVDWQASYTVDGTAGFSYSCLSLLPDGDLGILYEKYVSWSREQLHTRDCMIFESIPMAEFRK